MGRVNGVEKFIATGSANITSSLTNGDSYYGRVSGTADYDYGLISSGFTVTGSGFDVEDGYYAVDLSGLSFTDDTDPTVGANLRIEVTVNGDDLVDLDNYVSTTQTLYLEGDDNEITATVTGALSATASGTSWIGATQNYGLVRDIVDWVADQDDADVELSTGTRTNRINFVGGAAATNFNGIEVTFTWTLDHTDTGAALNLNAGNT